MTLAWPTSVLDEGGGGRAEQRAQEVSRTELEKSPNHRFDLSQPVRLAIFPSSGARLDRPRFFPEKTDVSDGVAQQMPPPSRRFHTRVESGKSVWAYWECSGDSDLSRVKNLSMGGLFIETSKLRRLGTATHLHFLVEEGQIRAEAVVRHVEPSGGSGLKFSAMTENDRPNLAALMKRLGSST